MMDESELRKLVEQWVDAWNANDVERIRSFYVEDAVFYQASVKKTLVGRDHIVARFEGFVEMSPDARLTIRGLHIDGQTAILEFNITGTHTGRFLEYEPTGRRMDIDSCLSLKFREDGKIVEHTTYLDTATVLRAVGLLSLPYTRPEAA